MIRKRFHQWQNVFINTQNLRHYSAQTGGMLEIIKQKEKGKKQNWNKVNFFFFDNACPLLSKELNEGWNWNNIYFNFETKSISFAFIFLVLLILFVCQNIWPECIFCSFVFHIANEVNLFSGAWKGNSKLVKHGSFC